jgi:hypothetical protein
MSIGFSFFGYTHWTVSGVYGWVDRKVLSIGHGVSPVFPYSK